MHSLEIIIMLKRKSIDSRLIVDTDSMQSRIKVALKSLAAYRTPYTFHIGAVLKTITEHTKLRPPPEAARSFIN